MNQQQPPQPETIMIECSSQNAVRTSESFDEWEVALPPIQLEKGDEISVNQSFLEARGTSTEILEFSSTGLNRNNRQKIYFEYYATDDGTNDKNKGRDWKYLSLADLKESAKTYKPCKAFRYDQLLEESTINANGDGLSRNIMGTSYQTIPPTSLDPRIINSFNINYKEDMNVAGVFNSVNALKEVRKDNPQPYIYSPHSPAGGNPQTAGLTDQEKVLTITDNIVNLDALDYWEIYYDNANQRVEFRIPYNSPQDNILNSFPKGSIIWIDWMPKRRQMSFYGGTPRVDTDYNTSTAPTNEKYLNYKEISTRMEYIGGHYVIGDTIFGLTFEDNGATSYGFAGQPCMAISIKTIDNGVRATFPDPRVSAYSFASATPNNFYVNPHFSNSKINLIGLGANDRIPINLCIRKSPYYIGSQKLAPNDLLNPNLQSYPSAMNSQAGQQVGHDPTTDPTMDNLFPLDPAQPLVPRPLYLGMYHRANTNDSSKEFTSLQDQRTGDSFTSLETGAGQHACNLIKYSYYNTGNPYRPIGFNNQFQLYDSLDGITADFLINFDVPLHFWERPLMPDNNIAVINRGTAYEEMIVVGKAESIYNQGALGVPATNPDRARYTITARNLNENQNLFINWTAPVVRVEFDALSPRNWVNDGGKPWDFYTHPITSSIEWWDWREGKNLQIEIDTENFSTYHPNGIPITKKCSYLGINEPSLNESTLPSFYTDNSLYTNLLKEAFKEGGCYFFYYNRVAVEKTSLPSSLYNANMDTMYSGVFGMNKGCWMFPLVESFNTSSAGSVASRGVLENPTLSAQVKTNSHNANAMTTTDQIYYEFNPHIPLWSMSFDPELDVGKIPCDFGGTTERNWIIWSPDVFDLRNMTDYQLKRWSNQGINYLCGYVPLLNEIEVETPKDYLTPTDLSNFWTEELHKSTDITCLLDGVGINKSKDRGIIQNPLLIPVYSSFGNFNKPNAVGLLDRDYFTFPLTNGYAMGSVIFIDGHEAPTDWTYSGANAGVPAGDSLNTSYIYPRNGNNLVHLWDAEESFTMPTYALPARITAWTGTETTATKSLVLTYTYTDYPVAPSGKSNNSKLSGNIQGGNSDITSVNLSGKGEPVASGANTYGNLLGEYDIFTTAGDTDEPYTGTATQREDPIYRETNNYPLTYFKDPVRQRYLRFSQYIGTDNLTLTYNTQVSAFEFQFLHQPFATSFALVNGVASGGDNAIRIYDHIPPEVNNWERYSGVNVRNWATPVIDKRTFTYNEIQNTPSFLITQFPNGMNPETDLDPIGDRFMNKLGYVDSQYNPRTGTLVKGTEGIGANPSFPLLYEYVPNGTTGADTDVADAIINTSVSAEDNPNSLAHGGLGQLIFYPSSGDQNTKAMRHTTTGGTASPDGVRYDFARTLYGQRGGLKSTNHNKAMGFPNIVGTPQVIDPLTFPRTLNPDGEQRSGYTIEIGSSPVRAKNLPIKLTDGYYYILCPTLIDDPQFYITAQNGMVIPAIAIISKTYVSGDFYTTFQSPITFYAKKRKLVSNIKIQIRNSSMGVPSNLGQNSSVIFSIKRYYPKIEPTPLTTQQKQNLAYKQLATMNQGIKPQHLSIVREMMGIGQGVITGGDPNQEEYMGGLINRIQSQLGHLDPHERRAFLGTNAGATLNAEMTNVLTLAQQIGQYNAQPDPADAIIRGAIADRREEAERPWITTTLPENLQGGYQIQNIHDLAIRAEEHRDLNILDRGFIIPRLERADVGVDLSQIPRSGDRGKGSSRASSREYGGDVIDVDKAYGIVRGEGGKPIMGGELASPVGDLTELNMEDRVAEGGGSAEVKPVSDSGLGTTTQPSRTGSYAPSSQDIPE